MTWTDNEIHTMIKDGVSLTAFLKAKKVSPTGKPRDILRQDLTRLGYASINLLKNIRRRKWTKEQVSKAVKESFGFVDCYRLLTGKHNKTGKSIRRLKKLILEYGIDTSHFQDWHIRVKLGTNKHHGNIYSDAEVFKLNTKATRRTVYDRYTTINPPICCSKCQLKEWLGEPLTVQLDHIDGNRNNCSLINLRWLCPNCHSQTETYSRGLKSMIVWPSDNKLIEMNKTTNGTKIAKILKASPTHVAKKLRIARSRLQVQL